VAAVVAMGRSTPALGAAGIGCELETCCYRSAATLEGVFGKSFVDGTAW